MRTMKFFATVLVVLCAGLLHAAEPIFSGGEIQKRLDALPASGGEVKLEPGLYILSQPVVLRRDGQYLRGSGPNTVLRLANGSDCPVVVLGTTLNDPKPYIHNLHLSDLTIDGNRSHQSSETWKIKGEGSHIRNNGVTVRGVEDALVERVTAFRCRSGGMVTERWVWRLAVCDFTSYDNEFDGLAVYQTYDSVFTRLQLHHNVNGAGISIDLDFNDNVISDSVLAENDLGIFMRTARRNIFQGVTIRNSKSHGIFMAQTPGEMTARGPTMVPGSECSENLFSGLMIQNSGKSAIRVNDIGCTNNMVSGAFFVNNKEGGMSEVVPGMLLRSGVSSSP